MVPVEVGDGDVGAILSALAVGLALPLQLVLRPDSVLVGPLVSPGKLLYPCLQLSTWV